jgi:DNA-binding FadR family transcriptional regulator
MTFVLLTGGGDLSVGSVMFLAPLIAGYATRELGMPVPVGFLQCDMRFHREIARITGNSIFPSLSEALTGWLAEFYHDLVRSPGTELLTLQEHAAILAAIRARDADAAERAMRDHLTRANSLFQRLATPAGDRDQP